MKYSLLFLKDKILNQMDLPLLKRIGGAFSINIAGLAISYILQLLLARTLSVRDYGNYLYFIALATVISNFSGLGLPIANLRFIPSYIIQKDWSLLKGLIQESLLITLSVGVSVSALGTLAISGFGFLDGSEIEFPLLVGLWMAPLISLIFLQSETIKAFGKTQLSLAPFSIGYPLFIILGIAVGSIFIKNQSLLLCLVLTLLSLIAVFFIQGIIVKSNIPYEALITTPKSDTKNWLKVASALLLARSFTIIIKQHSDILMIRAFSGPEEVALYSVAFKLASLVSLVLIAVNAVSAPIYSSLYAERKQKELQELVSREAHYTFWSALSICLAIIFLSNYLLALFGPEFLGSKSQVIVLLVGQLFNAGAGSVAFLLNMTGHQNETAKVLGFSALFNLTINSFLIPKYGGLGAAIGTCLTTILWNVWLAHRVFKRIGIKPSIVAALSIRN